MGKPQRLNVRRNIPITEKMISAGLKSCSHEIDPRQLVIAVFTAMIEAYQKTDERFWAMVNKTSTCWLWTGSKTKKGYGSINRGNMATLAHRWSYILEHGSITNNLHVLHKCDIPLCVNPAHLYLGTNDDNSKDRMDRGRHRVPYGEQHFNAKLTDAKVREIRASIGIKHRDLAKQYGVTQPIISAIKRLEIWKHVK